MKSNVRVLTRLIKTLLGLGAFGFLFLALVFVAYLKEYEIQIGDRVFKAENPYGFFSTYQLTIDDKSKLSNTEVMAEAMAKSALHQAFVSKLKSDFETVCSKNSIGESCLVANRLKNDFLSNGVLDLQTLNSGQVCQIAMWSNTSVKHAEAEKSLASDEGGDSNQIVIGENDRILSSESYDHQVDTKLGEEACLNASNTEPSVAEWKYSLGRIYEIYGAYFDAAAEFKKAAGLGHGGAFRRIGHLYGASKLGIENQNESVVWFKRGAKKGLVEPQVSLGLYYQYGHAGLPVNHQLAKKLLLEAYRKKSAKAALGLGDFYRDGFDGTPKPQLAMNLYREAARWGNSDGHLKQADILFDGLIEERSTSQDKRAFKLILKAKQPSKNPWAFHYEGWAYEHGRGAPIDTKKAIASYEIGIKYRFGYSAINIGNAYRFGRLGKIQDKSKALDFFDKAASLGESEGYLYHAQMLFNGELGGKSVDADIAAVDLIRKSIDFGGTNWAFRNLAWAKLYGRGIKKDADQAKKELVDLIENRLDAHSAYLLGIAYRDGVFGLHDGGTANDYFSKASELHSEAASVAKAFLLINGHLGAINSNWDRRAFRELSKFKISSRASTLNDIGWTFEVGIGTSKNIDNAIAYYSKATELGDSTAANNLAKIYRHQKNEPVKALQYVSKAIELGHVEAVTIKADMFFDGFLKRNSSFETISDFEGKLSPQEKKNSDEYAFELIRKSSAKFPKNPTLKSWLAWAFEFGRGVTKDTVVSRQLYAEAAALGDQYSLNKLIQRRLRDERTKTIKPILTLLESGSKQGDIPSTSQLMRLYGGWKAIDVHKQVVPTNCVEARKYFIRLIDLVSKSRKIRIFSDAFEHSYKNFELSVDETLGDPCMIASASEASLSALQGEISDANFDSNIVALEVFQDLLTAARSIEDQTVDWISQKQGWLNSKLNKLDPDGDVRVLCLSARQYWSSGKFTNALSDYALAAGNIDFEVWYSTSCQNFIQLNPGNLVNQPEFDEVVSSLEKLWQHKDKFPKSDFGWIVAILYAGESSVVKIEDVIEHRVITYPSNPLSYPLAKRFALEKGNHEFDHWAGYALAQNVLFGRQGAGKFLKKLKRDSKPFWEGVQSSLTEACVYEGAKNGVKGHQVLQAIDEAMKLGSDMAVKNWTDKEGKVRLLRVEEEEHWTQCGEDG